ncbi:12638_t:CDS:1 [Acaulospora morrowiae]|uniref:12638_t:CDS:1 n=1 Tax=Acaulospora morrowiae TaxID=94023 RepID=A0A9N8VTG2_9GLOM|nr:12638_t:CDS:1 [Acaulospora morrowiae]
MSKVEIKESSNQSRDASKESSGAVKQREFISVDSGQPSKVILLIENEPQTTMKEEKGRIRSDDSDRGASNKDKKSEAKGREEQNKEKQESHKKSNNHEQNKEREKGNKDDAKKEEQQNHVSKVQTFETRPAEQAPSKFESQTFAASLPPGFQPPGQFTQVQTQNPNVTWTQSQQYPLFDPSAQLLGAQTGQLQPAPPMETARSLTFESDAASIAAQQNPIITPAALQQFGNFQGVPGQNQVASEIPIGQTMPSVSASPNSLQCGNVPQVEVATLVQQQNVPNISSVPVTNEIPVSNVPNGEVPVGGGYVVGEAKMDIDG